MLVRLKDRNFNGIAAGQHLQKETVKAKAAERNVRRSHSCIVNKSGVNDTTGVMLMILCATIFLMLTINENVQQ